MKKSLIIIIILSLLGYAGYRIIFGPIVSIKEKIEIKKFAENYLTKKYGEHNFKTTNIRYEYNMTKIFDYSDPKGYWVYFKSDKVPKSWITINGLTPDTYEVNTDHYIQSYYFSEKDGYDIHKTLYSMAPKKELERLFIDQLRDEFEPNVSDIKCRIVLDIPENYGKTPTIEELKTDINLYHVSQFDYKVSYTIEDTDEYKERLKSYITNKYNCNSSIYFNMNNTIVSVFFEY